MSICALDRNTVKLITTAQVITSVSTATKELIENAFDAGAKNVEINLVDHGASLIEVKDDGHGICKKDAPYMALPSYTSKITNFSDLEILTTYGFRGEALSALCKVADVGIITKTDDDDTATSYTLDNNGNITKSEPHARTTGTTVQVRNLFKQLPVRRQIITNGRKANQDLKLLESLLKAYAICLPAIRISYRVNNAIVFTKPSMNTMKEVVSYILGKKILSNMDWIQYETTETYIELMTPSKGIQDTAEVFQSCAQYIFVNNRPIKSKELEKIITDRIMEYFGDKILGKKKPVFLLHIVTDPKTIDINLEPNKSTILLKDQDKFFNTVDAWIAAYYGLLSETTEEEVVSNHSDSCYLDYTSNIIENTTETEIPACKKRKVEVQNKINEEHIKLDNDTSKDSTTNNTNFCTSDKNTISNTTSTECQRNKELGTIEKHKKSDVFAEDIRELTKTLVPPDLSDSDSNDVQEINVVSTGSDNLSTTTSTKDVSESTADSQPLEFSPQIRIDEPETFSQLPVVDLGDDFNIDKILGQSTNNNGTAVNDSVKNFKQETVKKETSEPSKQITLEEWSKGHVQGLKGGTNVMPYRESVSKQIANNSPSKSTACTGFAKFSKHTRSLILKENPTLSIAQVAQRITDMWKSLTSAERGYYRDMAREEQQEIEIKKSEKREKEKLSPADLDKNRKRLETLLQNMKYSKTDTKEKLVMRTTVSWDISLQKVINVFKTVVNKRSSREHVNFVIGKLSSGRWFVHNNSQICILNAARLRTELSDVNINENQMDAADVEKLFNRWLKEKDDMSLLVPLFSSEITDSLQNSFEESL